jgi:hypothetical protein
LVILAYKGKRRRRRRGLVAAAVVVAVVSSTYDIELCFSPSPTLP